MKINFEINTEENDENEEGSNIFLSEGEEEEEEYLDYTSENDDGTDG